MQFLNQLLNLDGKKILLASKSPRRQELLKLVGVNFSVFASQVEEAPQTYENPVEYARHTALSKLHWVWENTRADIVIAADTIVVKDGKIYEKPGDSDDARRILRTLSGETHQVITAFAIKTSRAEVTDFETSMVTFCELSDNEIDAYLKTGEPFDKAGAYGIQGYGAVFIKKIDGCYFNVMGFPLSRFYRTMVTLGDD